MFPWRCGLPLAFLSVFIQQAYTAAAASAPRSPDTTEIAVARALVDTPRGRLYTR